MDREEMIRTLADAICRLDFKDCSVCLSDVKRVLEAIDAEGWFIGTPTDRDILDAIERSTYSEIQVVNDDGGIYFTIDASAYGAAERACYWRDRIGDPSRVERVTYETWTTPARRVALNGTEPQP
jgi:hypothetical protein